MPELNRFIKDVTQNFLFQEKLTAQEQFYLQELIPLHSAKSLTVSEYIEMFNEVASFYSGEMARLIKDYLLSNNLLCKDHARILKEELMFFRKFFHFVLSEIEKVNLLETTRKRLQYVIIKIDTYLKKYTPYLSI